MTLDTFLWIIGAACLPCVGWGIHITWNILEAKKDIKQLLEIHANPDKYGFGTEKQTRVIEDNTRAMKALTYYIRWLGSHSHGDTTDEKAPPYLEDV